MPGQVTAGPLARLTMPFTFAHPAAVLPLCRRPFVTSALVVGSMSPDFEYFLRGRPFSEISHTVLGLFIFCLPVALLVFVAFEKVCRAPIVAALPTFLGSRMPTVSPPWSWGAVIASILLGAVTHVVWDSFTHGTGLAVRLLPVLREEASGISIYRILQHTSTVVGFLLIGLFVAGRLRRQLPATSSEVPRGLRIAFWCAALLAPAAFFVRSLYVNQTLYTAVGRGVVQGITSAAIVTLLYSAAVSWHWTRRLD